jgi:hypothetical protein
VGRRAKGRERDEGKGSEGDGFVVDKKSRTPRLVRAGAIDPTHTSNKNQPLELVHFGFEFFAGFASLTNV